MGNSVMNQLRTHTLLLVEGKDEKHICELFLSKMQPDFAQFIDVQSADGGDDVWAQANALNIQSGFKAIRILAIICDAEETPQSTATRWTLFKTNFEAQYLGKTCDFLILPSEEQAGAIDSVFLNSLDRASNPLAACALDFAACVGVQGSQTTQARRDKLALTSYINANTKNPYSRVGVAVKQGAKDLFEFDHPSFAPLTIFLQKLLN
jgi:hypothetical protein